MAKRNITLKRGETLFIRTRKGVYMFADMPETRNVFVQKLTSHQYLEMK